MSKSTKSGLDAARKAFEKAQLTLPPVPARFEANLRVITKWCFATRSVDAEKMFFFKDYWKELLTKKVPDYVAFCHFGYGTNSYALTYHLVDGPLAIIAQVEWGGAYSTGVKDAERVNELFARCEQLIAANEKAKARGLTGPPGRLIVAESSVIVGGSAWWGWLDGPLRAPGVSDWLDDHVVKRSTGAHKVDEANMPTMAALKWLDATHRRLFT